MSWPQWWIRCLNPCCGSTYLTTQQKQLAKMQTKIDQTVSSIVMIMPQSGCGSCVE